MNANPIQPMRWLRRTGVGNCRYAPLAAFFAAITPPADGQPLQLVSVLDPPQGSLARGGGGESLSPIVSPGGRYVLFASTASDLATTMDFA